MGIALSSHPALTVSPSLEWDADVSGSPGPAAGAFSGYNDTICLCKAGRGYQPSGYWGFDDGSDPGDVSVRSEWQHVDADDSILPTADRSRGGGHAATVPAAEVDVYEDIEVLAGMGAATGGDKEVFTELLPPGRATTATFEGRPATELLPTRPSPSRAQHLALVHNYSDDDGGFGDELTPEFGQNTDTLEWDAYFQEQGAKQQSSREGSGGEHGQQGTGPVANAGIVVMQGTQRGNSAACTFEVQEDIELIEQPRSSRANEVFNVHEDTELLSSEHPALSHCTRPSEAFAVHEDTELLKQPRGSRPTEAFNVHEDTELLSSEHPALSHCTRPLAAFAVHEDTKLLKQPRGSRPTEAFDVHEDTELLSPQHPALSQSARPLAAFAVHEDTELFKQPRGSRPTETFDVHEDTELLSSQHPALSHSARPLAAFAVHEDTELLSARPSAAFAVHEDTELLKQPRGSRPTAAFDVHEDTELLSLQHPALSHSARPSAAFAVHEDTEPLKQPRSSRPTEAFDVHEDTELLSARPSAAFAVHEDTEPLKQPRSSRPTEAFDVHEDTELLSARPSAAFAVHEDTELLKQPESSRPTEAFDVHEDTELLCSQHTTLSHSARPSAAFAVHEDTVLLARGARDSVAAFAVREDTKVHSVEARESRDSDSVNQGDDNVSPHILRDATHARARAADGVHEFTIHEDIKLLSHEPRSVFDVRPSGRVAGLFSTHNDSKLPPKLAALRACDEESSEFVVHQDTEMPASCPTRAASAVQEHDALGTSVQRQAAAVTLQDAGMADVDIRQHKPRTLDLDKVADTACPTVAVSPALSVDENDHEQV
jgi:hypothetical protein